MNPRCHAGHATRARARELRSNSVGDGTGSERWTIRTVSKSMAKGSRRCASREDVHLYLARRMRVSPAHRNLFADFAHADT